MISDKHRQLLIESALEYADNVEEKGQNVAAALLKNLVSLVKELEKINKIYEEQLADLAVKGIERELESK